MKTSSDYTQDKIAKLVEATAVKRASLIEAMVIPYLQKTGLTADQIELVEKHENMAIVWYFRKKGSSD